MQSGVLGGLLGVSRLQLCDGNRWKEAVRVCSDLYSIRSNGIMGPGSIQGNECSFGHFVFVKWPRRTRNVPVFARNPGTKPQRFQSGKRYSQIVAYNRPADYAFHLFICSCFQASDQEI